jgi:cytochrome oxidase Cu insertion factor (SCO1/SenC/PrrC family)
MRFKTVAAIILITFSLSCTTNLNSTISDPDELKPRSSQLEVGEMAPDFTLEDQNNQKVTLSSARAGRPAILVFYRGYW